ncbi:hypothetical protein [Polyangium sp. y55x31]|uniref:hypothetical protein n=1 Tax=Polyangium sp. y55x31 TaxID=3042688 RepID=UPI002482DE6B|nr:hypothetical protein [Polyangium sp. y55x31]MDI1482534.1 hypothetical protein [Polyangium sp. y55x31]
MGLPSHWWKDQKPFLDALFAETAGDSGQPGKSGWVWLSEQQSREASERIRSAEESEAPLGAWMPPEAHEACVEMLEGVVPLATRGDLRADRWMRKIHNPMLFADPARPDQLWIALHESAPPPLWIPAGTTADSLAAAFAPYAWPETQDPLPSVVGLSRSVRIFIGTETGMGADFDTIVRFFQGMPMTDSLPWGTRFSEDPWPDRPTGIALIGAGYRMAENMAQAEGAVPSITMRSRRLGAALSVSSMEQFCVLEVRYTPVAHESILPLLTQLLPGLPKGLPSDMPVDALAVVARCRGYQADALLEFVRDPEEVSSLGYHAMGCLAVMGDDGAAVRTLLAELGGRDDPRQRSLGYHVASVARHKRFLHEALLRETDESNVQTLKNALRP